MVVRPSRLFSQRRRLCVHATLAWLLLLFLMEVLLLLLPVSSSKMFLARTGPRPLCSMCGYSTAACVSWGARSSFTCPAPTGSRTTDCLLATRVHRHTSEADDGRFSLWLLAADRLLLGRKGL